MFFIDQVYKYQSAQPLGIDDFYILGESGMATQDYGLAAQWFDMAVTRGMQQQEQQEQQQQQEQQPSFSLSEACYRLAEAHNNVTF